MIKRALFLTLLGTTLLAAGPASSKGFKYSFADFLYNNIDGGNEFADADSFSAKGSFAVHDYVHLIGGIERGQVDAPQGAPALDATEFTVGIGGNYDFSKTVSTYLDALWFDTKLNSDETTLDQGGYKGEAGLRYQVNKPLELNLYYVYTGGEVDAGALGGRFLINITKKVKFHLGYLAGEDNEPRRLSGGVRLNF